MGVRRSWDTDSRKCRSWSRARPSSSAIELIDRARMASSSSAVGGGTGKRGDRSPVAMRLVVVAAARTGRPSRRPRKIDTTTPNASDAPAETRNQRNVGPKKRSCWRVRTVTIRTGRLRTVSVRPAAAHSVLPFRPDWTSPARSVGMSRSSARTPWGSSPTTRPAGPTARSPTPVRLSACTSWRRTAWARVSVSAVPVGGRDARPGPGAARWSGSPAVRAAGWSGSAPTRAPRRTCRCPPARASRGACR